MIRILLLGDLTRLTRFFQGANFPSFEDRRGRVQLPVALLDKHFKVRYGRAERPRVARSSTVLSGVRPNVKNAKQELILPASQSLAYTFSYVSN